MNTLSNFQKGQIAGFIDGEGTIALTKSKSERSIQHNYTPRITVVNTFKPALEYLEKLTGIGTIIYNKVDNNSWKDSYRWSIETSKQKQFLQIIISSLRSKKEQAKILLEYHDIPLSKHEIGVTGSVPLSDKTRILKDILVEECMSLNKRGVNPETIYDPKRCLDFKRNIITEEQLGWISAIIDGEGHLGIVKIGKKYGPIVQVENTSINILETLEKYTRIGNFSKVKQRKENWKSTWVWSLNRKDILNFCLMIEPHLIIKREQCKLLIEYMNLPTNRTGQPVPMILQIDRDLIYEEMRELNRRGIR